ncbi:MAG: YjjG family noncanonical pyrimidine nucleotidase [Firmicutes bacterium]|nr:YjjG family noncanonical pyrimidine nucleotidase [Bacillota bacterium]
MRKYDTLLLDADGTLFDFDLSERTALTNVLDGVNIKADENILSAYHEINAERWRALERGETTRDALKVERFSRLIGYLLRCGCSLSIKAEDMAKKYENELSHQGFLIEGAVEVVRALSAECELYIITNGVEKVQRGRFSSSPIMPYIKDVFISENIGAVKPDTEFFRIVLSSIGIDFDDSLAKSRVLVVGDSQSSDIRGGVDSGLDTCWYNPSGKASGELPSKYEIKRLYELLDVVGVSNK